MKCSNVQRYCWEMAGSPLPPAMEEHIRQCPGCKSAFEKANSLCKLISLKRFEQPDSAAEARCIAAVQSKIDSWHEHAQGWSWSGIFGLKPAAVFSGVCVLLILGFIGTNRVPTKSPAIAAEETSDAVVILQVASNAQPGRVQYGPGPSRVVDYEY